MTTIDVGSEAPDADLGPAAGGGGTGATAVRALHRLGSWRVVLISGTVFLAFAGVFFASTAPFSVPTVEQACGQPPPDVRTFSTGDDVGGFLAACGAAGRDAYRSLQLADLAYPAVYGVFMASCLALVLRRLAPGHPSVVLLAGLALLGTGFDYLENLFAWRALASFPEPAGTDALLGFASAAKNVASWTAGLVLVAGTGALAVRAVARRRRARRTAAAS